MYDIDADLWPKGPAGELAFQPMVGSNHMRSWNNLKESQLKEKVKAGNLKRRREENQPPAGL